MKAEDERPEDRGDSWWRPTPLRQLAKNWKMSLTWGLVLVLACYGWLTWTEKAFANELDEPYRPPIAEGEEPTQAPSPTLTRRPHGPRYDGTLPGS